jgi:twinkle protein
MAARKKPKPEQTELSGEIVNRTACPHCDSSDAYTEYSDGHAKCYSCGEFEPPNGGKKKEKKVEEPIKQDIASADLIQGSFVALKNRGISQNTCKKFGVSYGKYNDEPVLLEGHYNKSGELVAQKVRFPDKRNFPWVGDPKKALLFGQHLWKEGGKRIIITEGAMDALSYAEATDCNWPVVSIISGAQSAHTDCQKHLQFLNSFEEIILWFDNDEPGRAAIDKCKTLFEPGKVKIVTIPDTSDNKDANDVLLNDGKQALMKYIWQAQEYKPQGLLKPSELISKLEKVITWGQSWGWDAMDKITYGRRDGEVYTFGGAQGSGKTDILTQLSQNIIEKKLGKVGCFFLEAQPEDIVQRIVGKVNKRAYHLPDHGHPEEERIRDIHRFIDNHNEEIFLYDNFGECEWTPVKETIRYLNKAQGYKDFVLDNLTAFAASADDEKKFLEETMAEIAKLTNELKIKVYLVSHLATPEGKPHEAGAKIYPRHFKGSRAIAFWSHFMFGFERDQFAENPFEKNTTKVVCLKDRFSGKGTGQSFYLNYDHREAYLKEVSQQEYDKMVGKKEEEQKQAKKGKVYDGEF